MAIENGTTPPPNYERWVDLVRCITGPETYGPNGQFKWVEQPLVRYVKFPHHIPGMTGPDTVKVQVLGSAPGGYRFRVREHGILPEQALLGILPEPNEDTGENFTAGVLASRSIVPPFTPMLYEHELNQPQGSGIGYLFERKLLPPEKTDLWNLLYATAYKAGKYAMLGAWNPQAG